MFPSIYGAGTEEEKEANKMFIIWLPVWGTGKKEQDTRFDSHLTGVKKESFIGSRKQ